MNSQSIKILLVEDNSGDARLVRAMLFDRDMDKSIPITFDLTHVERLGQALTSLAEETFDIILLDLSLPDEYGLETVNQVQDAAPDVPIVVMSGLSDEALAIKAVQEGAQDYLVKGHVDGYSLIRSLRYAIERKRVETAEREQRQLAEALRDIIAALNSTLDLQEVLDRILTNVGRVVPHHTANIMLIESGLAHVVGGRGYTERNLPSMVGHYFSISDLPTLGQMTKTGQPLVISDTQDDPFWVDLPETGWIRSYAGTPIHRRGEIVGFINLASDTPGFFTNTHARRLQAFAEQTGIAIGNASLLEAEREQRLLAGILTEVTLALTSRVSNEDILDEILRQVQRLVPYKAANIMLLEGESLRIARWQGYEAFDGENMFSNLVQPLTALQADTEVVQSKKPVVISDTHQDPRWVMFDETAWIRSNLIVPICLHDRVLGVLRLDGDTVDEFSTEDAERLQPLANAAAIALGNAQLFEATQQHVAKLEAIRQASLSLTSSLELEAVLEAILKSALNLLASLEGARIYLYQGDSLTFGAALWADGVEGRSLSKPSPRGLTYTVAQRGEAIVIPNTCNHPLYTNMPSDHEGAIVGLPLKIGQRVVGVMNVECQQPRLWPEDELRVLRLLADQAAIAIENARLFEQAQQEIAERKRAEAELNEYREHLEDLVRERTAELEQSMRETAETRDKIDAILRSVADGLIVTDLDHKIILANPAAEALLEFRQEEMLGREVGAGIKDDQLREIVRHALDQHSSDYEVDIELEDPQNKRKKVLRARTALVDDRRGQPLGTVTIIQDVTRLREIDQLKTDLLTTTAHELRTPLTSILGFSEILLTRQLDQSRQEHYLRMINEQSNHLAQIVEELVDLSRMEAGRGMDLKLETVNVAKLMEEVAMLFAEQVTKHNIQIEGLEKLPLVLGDPFRLTQVGQNLLSNAINYSPKGGTITIRGRIVGDYLEISLQDEGIGVTPDQQEHLFKPFYRADASDTAISGTGLGLAITKLIIEQHGGQVWLESEQGIGTTVYFTLPLAQKQTNKLEDKVTPSSTEVSVN
jgi:PAS domain S-box-containing protein